MGAKVNVTHVEVKPKMAFRYVCHGCTRPAAYSAIPQAVAQATCPHCGLIQQTKAENWILMGEAEAAAVNK